jgi:metacaspase-1
MSQTSSFIELFERLSNKGKLTPAQAMTAAATAPHSAGVTRFLGIGINYYHNSSGRLNGCHNDVANVVAWLRTCGVQNFKILLDRNGDKKYTDPDCPTKVNIIKAIKEIVAQSKAGDTIVFHYSGHGSFLKDGGSRMDERDGNDECICCVDYELASPTDPDCGFIRDDDLYILLVKSLAPGVKLRAIFDSCHSGSVLDLPLCWISNTRMATENTEKIQNDVVMVSGCMDSQTSSDAMINGSASGAMTWALLAVLGEIRQSGKNASKWTWKELVQQMRAKLRIGQYEQIPCLSIDSAERATAIVDLI